MPIDIQYLLFLQDLRNATGGVFNEFFNSMSNPCADNFPIEKAVNKNIKISLLFTAFQMFKI